MKETDIHFSIEQVQSKIKNSETFDAADGLKSPIKNGTSFIGKVRNKKSISSGKKEFKGRGTKSKSTRPKFLIVGWSQSKKRKEKKENHYDVNTAIRRIN